MATFLSLMLEFGRSYESQESCELFFSFCYSEVLMSQAPVRFHGRKGDAANSVRRGIGAEHYWTAAH
jgi:hypothetical protein